MLNSLRFHCISSCLCVVLLCPSLISQKLWIHLINWISKCVIMLTTPFCGLAWYFDGFLIPFLWFLCLSKNKNRDHYLYPWLWLEWFFALAILTDYPDIWDDADGFPQTKKQQEQNYDATKRHKKEIVFICWDDNQTLFFKYFRNGVQIMPTPALILMLSPYDILVAPRQNSFSIPSNFCDIR